MSGSDALVLRDVRRSFGRTVALDGASCTVRRGTIHALLGENGAGKTTLMRIAFGLLAPDAGELWVNGVRTTLRSSRDGIALGMGMVHQHFMLVPAMTVAENVALGGRGRFDRDATTKRIAAIAKDSGLVLEPESRVADLPVGAQQRLEIIKALAHDARLLILDEPTAVLSPSEGADLLRWSRRFAAGGGTIVLITHKLRDALEFADDITVLRRGRTVLAGSRGGVTETQVIAALVGEAGPALHASRPSPMIPTDAEPVLHLDGVDYVDARGVTRLRDVTLDVRAGEVVGVIGVEGAGQHELLRILAGRLEPTRGRATRPARVGFIPEDRLHDALIPELTLTENLALARAGAAHGRLPWEAMRHATTGILRDLDVRADGPESPARALSGGNQQKFVVGRERHLAGSALVAENPTRGLDLRASARVLDEIARAGGSPPPAVVMYSSDLDEVLAVATRVVACFNGSVREVTPASDPEDLTPYARALLGAP
ncbi:MAG: ATP-binding cassette domain-containing protein [Gemmatimonadetes bacterium]|nr:ATP-binding cassette domain-containing protein [Gemmatimonadota bacterium]